MIYVNLDDFMGNDYTNWIFDKITVPGVDSAEYANILYSGHSGEKWISPLCIKLNNKEDLATDETKTTLANLIKVKYLENWTRLYNALFADYNPIENYSLDSKETIDRDTTDKGTNSNKSNSSSTDTNTTKSEATNNTDENGDSLNQVYAEDSETAVNAGKNITTGKTVNSSSGTDTSNGSSSNDTTDSGEFNNQGTEDVITTTKKSGNIGVTTSQQMIESEVALRKHNYYDIIFKDIDDLLCLSIY